MICTDGVDNIQKTVTDDLYLSQDLQVSRYTVNLPL